MFQISIFLVLQRRRIEKFIENFDFKISTGDIFSQKDLGAGGQFI